MLRLSYPHMMIVILTYEDHHIIITPNSRKDPTVSDGPSLLFLVQLWTTKHTSQSKNLKGILANHLMPSEPEVSVHSGSSLRGPL